MPKRKLSDVDSGPKRTYNVQTMRLTQKFEQGVVLLSRALKVAKGFERQKLSRREKTAKSQGSSEALQKIAEEIAFIKVCLVFYFYFFFLFVVLYLFDLLGSYAGYTTYCG